MTTQLHLTYAIDDRWTHADQDQVLLRNVELARQDARRARRAPRLGLRRR
jgi:hypothetical protein